MTLELESPLYLLQRVRKDRRTRLKPPSKGGIRFKTVRECVLGMEFQAPDEGVHWLLFHTKRHVSQLSALKNVQFLQFRSILYWLNV